MIKKSNKGEWNSELYFSVLFAYLIFVWYEPDPPRFAKVTWKKIVICLILPFSSNGQFPNEIIWFQSRNNKFAVFLSLGKISASILQQMENGQIQQQKYFFQKKILNLRMFFEDIPKKVNWLNLY